VRIGREIAYAEAVVTDDRGSDVARASGTYSVTKARA
jgi:acyl-coenzyme A thioesterase PaaI-like protein